MGEVVGGEHVVVEEHEKKTKILIILPPGKINEKKIRMYINMSNYGIRTVNQNIRGQDDIDVISCRLDGNPVTAVSGNGDVITLGFTNLEQVFCSEPDVVLADIDVDLTSSLVFRTSGVHNVLVRTYLPENVTGVRFLGLRFTNSSDQVKDHLIFSSTQPGVSLPSIFNQQWIHISTGDIYLEQGDKLYIYVAQTSTQELNWVLDSVEITKKL